MHVWRRVTSDFDFYLDASSAAWAFMLSYCADPGPLDDVLVDDEPTRLALHIATGVHRGWRPTDDDLAAFGRAFGALLVSRPVTPDMLAALTLCAGAPGRTLTDLPWAEPEWDTPADRPGPGRRRDGQARRTVGPLRVLATEFPTRVRQRAEYALREAGMA